MVELLVVIILLSIFALAAIATFNPKEQLAKAKDAQRLHGLEQIRNALDTYYNDHGAYPTPPLPTGTWSGSGSTVYMEKVPVDPDTNAAYSYETGLTNPQWAVLYAKLSALTASCPLTKFSSCLPQNFNSSWSCLVLGNIDTSACTSIKSQVLP